MNQGYLSFTNEQFDWLMKQAGKLSKREMAILMGIIRFTFGFRRKEARLSGTYLQKATGIRSTHVPETLRKLSEKGIISVLPRAEKNTNTIRFDWTKVMVQDTPKTGVENLPNWEVKTSRNSSKLTPEMGDKTIKKTIKKDNKENTAEDNNQDEYAGSLF